MRGSCVCGNKLPETQRYCEKCGETNSHFTGLVPDSDGKCVPNHEVVIARGTERAMERAGSVLFCQYCGAPMTVRPRRPMQVRMAHPSDSFMDR